MFKISAITRVGLVAVVCVAVAAPSALAKGPAKVNAKSPYGYAMSYAPTRLTPEPTKPAKVQSWLYGYARFYTPTKLTPAPTKPAKVQSWISGYARFYTSTKATPKAAKPAKVQSPYGYAMSYTPTRPAKVQSLYGYAMSYTPTKATRKAAKPATQTAATPATPSAGPAVSCENMDYEYYGSVRCS